MQRVASLDSVSRDSTREAWSEAAAAAHTSIDDNALPFELRHALYDTLVDTRLRTRLLRELLPVRNMVLFFALGPTRSRRGFNSRDRIENVETGGTSQPNQSTETAASVPGAKKLGGFFSGSSPMDVPGKVAIVLCCLFAVNSVRGLAFLGKLGHATFPWVLGVVFLLWWSMLTVKSFSFVFSGGFERGLSSHLEEIQAKGLYLTTDAHMRHLRAGVRAAAAVMASLTAANSMLLPCFVLIPALGTEGLMRELICYPLGPDHGACTTVAALVMLLQVPLSAHWVVPVGMFVILCRTLRHAYAQLAAELPSRLHWCRTTETGATVKSVLAQIMLRHQELNDAVEKASKHWKWWIAAVIAFDVPLITFLVFQIIALLRAEEPANATQLGTVVFWACSGFVHLLAVSLSAAGVTSEASSLAHHMLEPRLQELLLGNSAETHTMVLVFNKYLDEHPPCFRFLHVRITMEAVSSVVSLIIGYIIVLATL
uniref:Uncharacterized protein n=1 Tax=Tetraselmis sp. GSL018 TaxID=582737 RepID=A0A061SLH1_9CHLO|mmetsp:Transcript_10950/g.26004  ORF Transcript_10950/g.26004 Transcript_10950/m.26004 type:complete len:484 (-) Transcript_10950:553-2004(-)